MYNRPGTSSTPNIQEADDDTLLSAKKVEEGLVSLGHRVKMLGIDQDEITRISEVSTDLVFNLVEWSGRECELGVRVCEALEKSRIPFTGSGARGYLLSCDKRLMKEEFEKWSIPTPRWQVVDGNNEKLLALPYPVIVKPTLEHCAIGISQKSVVNNENDLRTLIHRLLEEYKQPVLIEEYIEGLEGHVTVLEKDGKPWVLPPAVIEYKKQDGYTGILTYDVKWKTNTWEDDLSVWIDEQTLGMEILSRIEKICVDCYTHLGGRSYPRVDLRIRNSEIYVLEINNNPGIDFETSSGICRSAMKVGMTWEGLLNNIITEALKLG